MIYAKSNPPESLKEHTENVMKNFDLLKSAYNEQISNLLPEKYKKNFWKALEMVCYYHDFGKLFTPFQIKIIKAINPNQKQEIEKNQFKANIPHNFLSPAFIDRCYIEKEGISDELYQIIVQAITFHHENKRTLSKELKEEIKSAIDDDLSKNLDELNKEMGTNISKLNKKFTIDLEKRIKMNDKNYLIYLLLKGLLHRIDHSASAHVDIEIGTSENIESKVQLFINQKLRSQIRELQSFASNNKNENLILVASTGMGKTEAALMWIGKEKGFIVLPLRVTLNKMFSRLKNEVEIESTGLLHSTNLEYLLSEENDYINSFRIAQQSRQFAMKLNLTTVDQIFTFPFKPLGYEKVLSTLLYSRIVLDEIQAYSPNIVAAILKGIEILYKNGGKFMIMTATLPQIYRDYLDQKEIKYKVKEFLMDEDPSGIKNRHFMIVKDDDIINDVDNIVKYGKDRRVLVIVNTIKKAIEIYKKIRDKTEDVNLLHSLFIQKDKQMKEDLIYQCSKSNKPSIWIATQIVEASLDIDFDVLFTELSTLDSLFQRMGRCYRKREYSGGNPNVLVYSQASGIGTIYDKDIFSIGLGKINKDFNEKVISERSKIELVNSLYSSSSIKNTKYYEEFKKSLEVLDHTPEYEMDSKTAQSILRDIKSVKVIPREIYDQNVFLFDEYYKSSDAEQKRIIENKISSLSVDIPYYKLRKDSLSEDKLFRKFGLYILNFKYDQELGIQVEEELQNIIG